MARFTDLLRRRDGVTAVEFALIAPILVVTFMAAVEIPRAYTTARKVDRAARTMADLISRTSLTSLDDVYAAGVSVMEPLDVSGAQMRMAAIGVYTAGAARICSSAAKGGTPDAIKSSAGVAPPAYAAVGSRYVKAEVSLTYQPIFRIFGPFNALTIARASLWPIRRGTTYSGDPEVVMPGGAACSAT